MDFSTSDSIVCVDLASKLLSDDASKEDLTKIGQKLLAAFENIGFVYVKNHGIPQQLIDSVYETGSKFFDSPLEIKEKYQKSTFSKYDGYMAIDREKLFSFDDFRELRECFDVLDLSGPFPEEVEGFGEAISGLFQMGNTLGMRILTSLEIAMNLPEGTFTDKHQHPFSNKSRTTFRILNYPPFPDVVKEGTIRLGEHSDYGSITLLFQDNVGGLEVKNRRGEWVAATPMEGTILVNIGYLMEIWTSGKLVAAKHRIQIPKQETRQRMRRRSIAIFCHPDDDEEIRSLDNNPAYPSVNAKQYVLDLVAKTYKY